MLQTILYRVSGCIGISVKMPPDVLGRLALHNRREQLRTSLPHIAQAAEVNQKPLPLPRIHSESIQQHGIVAAHGPAPAVEPSNPIPGLLLFCRLLFQLLFVFLVPLGAFLRMLILHKVNGLDERMHHIVQRPPRRQGAVVE